MPNAEIENHYTTNIESKAVANLHHVGYKEPLHKILPGTTLDKRTCMDFWSIGDKPSPGQLDMMKTYRKGSKKRMLIAP
jgi:hypothetical protein